MIQKIATFLLMATITVASFVFATQPVLASNDWTSEACGAADSDQQAALGCNTSGTAPDAIAIMINAVIAILGIIAVIVIVVGGQRMIVSRGDPGKVTAAKGMIIYGVVGVVIALLAYAIVNFVANGIFSK